MAKLTPSRPRNTDYKSFTRSKVKPKTITRKGRNKIVKSKARYLSFGKAFPKMNIIFPTHKLFKLPYSQTLPFSPSTSLLNIIGATQQFCLNGIYDPDISGIGHQPLYRDTLLGATGGNAPYGRYKVIGCSVHLKWYDPKDDGTRCFWRVMNPTQVYNGETMYNQDSDASQEKLNTNSCIINNTGSQVKHINFFVPMYKGAGITKLQFNADPDNFTADYGSNPGSKVVLELGVSSSRVGNVTSEVVCQIDLLYHVILYGRNTVATS